MGSQNHCFRLTPSMGLDLLATLSIQSQQRTVRIRSHVSPAIISQFKLLEEPLVKALWAALLSMEWIHGRSASNCGHASNAIMGPIALVAKISVWAPVVGLSFCRSHKFRSSKGVSKYTGFGWLPSGESPNMTTPTPAEALRRHCT